jgi:uncharacterized protein (DUF1778 family)
MPRNLSESGRVELRLRPQDKATLSRAAALKRLDLTGYILGTVLPQAESDIAEAERLSLSERDSLRVLRLLENRPPPPDWSALPRPVPGCRELGRSAHWQKAGSRELQLR